MTTDSQSIHGRMHHTARRMPEKVALVDPMGPLTYQQLMERSTALAEATQQLSERERIGLYLPTSSAFAVCFYGILGAGRTAVPLNLLVGRDVLDFAVRDAELDLIYTVSPLAERIEGLAERVVLLDRLPPSAPPATGPESETDPQQIAVLLYTSGTLARPKGVPLSHRNIVSNLNGFDAVFDFDARDVFLALLPMFHTFALTTTLVLPMSIGATTVCMPRFQPGGALDLVEKHRVTAIMSIASMYRLLMHAYESEPRDLSSVRYWVAGGEPLPAELARRFEELFGATLLEGYGLTETAPVVCVNRHDGNRLGTAGLPLPNVRVKVVDEEGAEVPTGEPGELLVKGPNVMQGYFRRPSETDEAFTDDGWFRTGDVAAIDADGFVRICGRKKEFIIISGENVSPMEIENALTAHPAVFETGVVPAPDPRRGEVPAAFVALVEPDAATAEQLRAHCRRLLPPYKVPRRIVILEELPHGPTGKVLRRALRDLLPAEK